MKRVATALAALAALALFAGAPAAAQVSGDITVTGSGAAIPDDYPSGATSGVFTSAVAGATIGDVEVRINGLSHLWASDLIGTLSFYSSSFSHSVTLFDAAVGSGWGSSSGDYLFGSDPGYTGDATGAWWSNSGISVDMSGFAGADPNGLWQLNIVDNYAGDAGSFGSWEIGVTTAQTEVVPEPMTVVLMGTGLLGVGFVGMRRRREADAEEG